jgi:TonB family protein
VGALLFVGGVAASSDSMSFSAKPSSSALPMYPEGARRARVTGTVKLWFILDGNGAVTQAGVISGHPMLRDAAMSIVKSWHFQPNALCSNLRCETEFVYVLNVQPEKGEPRLIVSMADYRRVEVTSELYVEPIE